MGRGRGYFWICQAEGGRGGKREKASSTYGEKKARVPTTHAWLVGRLVFAVAAAGVGGMGGKSPVGGRMCTVGTRDSRWALSLTFSPSLPLSDMCAKGSSISSRYRTVEEEEREDRKRAPAPHTLL